MAAPRKGNTERVRIEQEYSLRHLNTFGIDAKASHFARVESRAELAALLRDPRFRAGEKLVLGGGSNLLFTRDLDGLVIRNAIGGLRVLPDDDDHALVEVGAGVVWHDLVTFCLERDLGGLENLSLIPGSVGASPLQNIGAYGVEIKDTFESLTAMEVATGEERVFTLPECRFGYRSSIFKTELRGQYIILSVRFRLTTRHHRLQTSYGAIEAELRQRGLSHYTIRDIGDVVTAIRRSKLPDPEQVGNAGSFFKNPEVSSATFATLQQQHPDIVGYPTANGVKLAAGWLIEQCGWKGKRVGNAGVHARHALVLVNHGGATGREVQALAQEIQVSVRERFGIALETEVNII